jgi:hypothetical protein
VLAGVAGRLVAGPESPCRRTATRAAPVGDDGPATGAHPVAADLLGGAADLLPAVASRPPVLACDLHTALLESAARFAASADRLAHLRAASSALDQFVSFLVASGHAAPAPRISQTLRGWLAGRDLGAVRQALATAADHCRRRGVPR